MTPGPSGPADNRPPTQPTGSPRPRGEIAHASRPGPTTPPQKPVDNRPPSRRGELPASYRVDAGQITARLTGPTGLADTDPAWTPVRATHVRPMPAACTGWACTGRTTPTTPAGRDHGSRTSGPAVATAGPPGALIHA